MREGLHSVHEALDYLPVKTSFFLEYCASFCFILIFESTFLSYPKVIIAEKASGYVSRLTQILWAGAISWWDINHFPFLLALNVKMFKCQNVSSLLRK